MSEVTTVSGPEGSAPPAPRRRSGLAWLPNAITLTNALCGFGAVVAVAGWTPDQGSFPVALSAWLILGAWVCDMADGTVARLTGTTGRFGAALDSLCDVVGFGVAPAFLAGTLASAAGWPSVVAWAPALVLLSCVLVRLARFDAEDVEATGPDGHLYFRGLPSPAVGVLIATLGLWFAQVARSYGIGTWGPGTLVNEAVWLGQAMPLVALLAAGLAVTVLPYPDLPKHYMKRLAPWWQPVAVLGAAAIVGVGPAFFAFFLGYALLGPWLGRRGRREARRS
ncbi:MAG: CDP-alcohol phosphatidyltransferase family protein [Candidatus Sericytochromatia bacterium]|nr:CDP-alcohol phosphatidyltransferase family protein [Candidatus Sericytochromatia bacterium]